MSMIKQLDMFTANSIAAGEVVDRPASVVKELCENSLDAAADIIHIRCEGGGVKRIEITDNGCGMDMEDALTAFSRHATSKLEQLEDLDQLLTMGFRGEALAAISAVSKVTLKTRESGTAQGTKVVIEGGELLEHLPSSCQEGTSFLVEDLFYNTPARYKFLKKDTTEAAKITDLVEKLALARPEVSFRLYHGGQEQLHSPGNNDLYSAIYSIFGRQTAETLIFLPEQQAVNGIPLRIDGYLSLPQAARKTKNYQYFYVNKRLVKSPILSKAVEEAYRGTLMKGQYPFCLLRLTLPPSLLDINVHPQKMELRFWQDQPVFSAVFHALKDCLAKNIRSLSSTGFGGVTETTEGVTETTEAEPEIYREGSLSNIDLSASNIDPSAIDQEEIRSDIHTGELRSDADEARYEAQALPGFGKENLFRWQQSATAIDDPTHAVIFESSESAVHFQEEKSEPDWRESRDHDLAALISGRIRGTLFDTYILIEFENNCVILDQHAAHERVLYERIMQQSQKEGHSQILLSPLPISVSASEAEVLKREEAFMATLGFDYSLSAERRVDLCAIPAYAQSLDPLKVFMEALDQLTEMETNLALAANREKKRMAYATKACKAAVKAHDVLTIDEQRSLLDQLAAAENPFQCPHGRPVFITYTRYELEKLFKRIV